MWFALSMYIEKWRAVETFPTVEGGEGRGLEGVQSRLSRAWKGRYHSRAVLFKGTLSRVDMRRSVNPRRLKKFSLRDKYVNGFSTTLSCIPLCHHTLFPVPSFSFLAVSGVYLSTPYWKCECSTWKHQAEFSSFGSDARACQPVTVSL